MKTNRRLSLFLGAVLAFTVVVGLQAYRSSSAAGQSSQPNPGMGELRHFEAQQTQANAVVGIGDLRRIEAQAPIIPVTGGSRNSLPISGMGDLRHFEVQQQGSPLNIGMGNLRRFEGEPATLDSTTPQSSIPITTITVLVRSKHSDTAGLSPQATRKGPGR